MRLLHINGVLQSWRAVIPRRIWFASASLLPTSDTALEVSDLDSEVFAP